MLLHHLKIAWRNLLKQRTQSIIAFSGLAISLACVIIVAQYVHQEKTVNHFAEDIDRTYIMTVEEIDGKSWFWGMIDKNDPNDKELLDNPYVERITSFHSFAEDYIDMGNSQVTIKSLGIDSLFLKILHYPVILGTNKMKSPTDAFVTERMAKRLFGEDNPVGKKVIHSTGEEITIVGVIGEPAYKSFLDFDLLINRDLKGMMGIPIDLILLHPGSDATVLNNSHKEFRESGQFAFKNARFQLFPLKDFYFDNRHGFPPNIYLSTSESTFMQGNKNAVNLLFIASILILLIGIFNFIHIYTVIVLNRGKEFGVKKMFGAKGSQIFKQIYLENILMTLIALFLAFFFAEIAEKMLAYKLHFVFKTNRQFIVILSLSVLLILPFITSFYPFIKYHFSAPITSLRQVHFGKGGFITRWIFLFMQYVITFVLIISAFFFIKQLRFMLQTDHGYNTKNVIMCRMMHRDFSNMERNDFEASMRKITENAVILQRKLDESVLFSDWEFGKQVYDIEANVRFRRTDKDEYKNIKIVQMSPLYLQMFEFELVKGRPWDSTDVDNPHKFILNEAARNLFNISDIHKERIVPEKSLTGDKINHPYEIVAIIRNFQTGHLSKLPTPIAIRYTEQGNHFDYLMAKFNPGHKDEAVSYLKSLYQEVNGNKNFTYSLLDDEIAKLYEEDKRVSNINILFAGLAVLISCMGLFALSLFDVQQRKREVALRKVYGASTKDIMRLMIRKYIFLLCVAFAIAAPFSYWFIDKYMESFAHRTAISWWLFALTAIIVTAISLFTLIWQIKRTLKTDPAEVLKRE